MILPSPPRVATRFLTAGITFQRRKSPLKYQRASGVERLALCDSSVTDPPAKGDTYFDHIERWRRWSKGRKPRKLTKPVLDEIIPGVADNCIVGFQDYHLAGSNFWYLDYMITRRDHRGEGYARMLVEEFYKRYAKPGVTIHWGKMMHPAVGHLLEQMKAKYPDTESIGARNW